MQRTMRLTIGLLLFAASLVPLAAGAEVGGRKRPNMVFVFADDWGRFASAYATIDGPGSPNDVVRTPNFDRIAAEGVLFRHAFVNAPSCTPCRSSLLSGQYFWRTGRGAILRGAVWDAAIPSFPLLLREAGYHIGKTYKVWSPGSPVDAPYGEQQFAYEQAGRRFNQFSQNVARAVAKGESIDKAKQALLNEVQANFAAFLANRTPQQPFYYWFGPTNGHRMWQRGSGKALWGIEPDRLRGKLPPFLPDVPEVREDFADYLGEIQALDAALGVLLAALEEAGELASTLIAVSGDHGPPGFSNGKCNLYDFGTAVALAIRGPGIPGGRVVDDFVNLPDLAPTFLEWAGIAPPEAMTAKSLVPVLVSRSQGLVDPNRDFVITGRERHVDVAREGGLPYPQRAIRTKDYLYIVNFKPQRWPLGDPYGIDETHAPDETEIAKNTRVTLMDMDAGPTKAWLVAHRNDPRWKTYYERAFGRRPREELYVLARDPHQTNNVAAAPEFRDVCRDLQRRLMAELQRTGDPRLINDGAYFENPPLAGPVSGH